MNTLLSRIELNLLRPSGESSYNHMTKESVYSPELIEKIRAEVDRQWNFHLLARAILPTGFEQSPQWQSPGFYKNRGFELQVTLRGNLPSGSENIGHWLNQNYILRLFGIFEDPEYRVITAGKIAENPFTRVAKLRNKIGHTSGYWSPESSSDQEVTKLIRKHIYSSIDQKDVERFDLAINTVLEPLKNKCLD